MGFNWIPYTLYEFGDIASPVNQILGIFSSFILLPPLLIFILIFHLGKKHLANRFLKILSDPFIICGFATLILELGPTQFPAFPGHTWIFLSPYLGLSHIFGEIIFTYCSFLISFQLITFFETKKLISSINIFLGLFFILNFYLKIEQPDLKKGSQKNINLRIVQANIGNDSKTASENGDAKSIFDIFRTYKELSNRPSDAPLDLIISPETAYPFNIKSEQFKNNRYYIPGIFTNIIKNTNAHIFTGIRDNPSGELLYNSGLLIKNNFNTQIYYKNKLLPFGEYIPAGPFTQKLKPYFPGVAFFDRGKETIIFDLKKDIFFNSLICYEVLFPQLIYGQLKEKRNKPDFMVNITNDSWYGNTSEPEQHLFLSRWRPIEFGVPLVRSTNTGITTVIYPDGSMSDRLNWGDKRNLDVRLVLTQKISIPLFFLSMEIFLSTFWFLFYLD